MNETILIIEDEPSIADNITYALSTEGFTIQWRSSGGEGLAALEAGDIDLLIIDVGLPDINGFELARKIRTRFTVPIIFVTARDSEVDRVVGLEIGGDDYMVKPFSPRELTARVRAVLRRFNKPPAPSSENPPLDNQSFLIDESRYSIMFQGSILDLSRYEFRILKVFIHNPERVFTREQLMKKAWDEPDMSLERTVDTHIKIIRKKLRAINPDKEWIVTHRGIGYSLKESP